MQLYIISCAFLPNLDVNCRYISDINVAIEIYFDQSISINP